MERIQPKLCPAGLLLCAHVINPAEKGEFSKGLPASKGVEQRIAADQILAVGNKGKGRIIVINHNIFILFYNVLTS